MAGLQIEGTIDGLRDKQIEFIRDVLEKRGFKNNKVFFEPASKSGDNYVANVSRITVTVEDGPDFKMFAKFAPENENIRQIMNIPILFNNEKTMYEEVLPKFANLQIAAEVPEKDLLKFAECYGYLGEQPNEVILLEDLKELDYTMLDRFASLPHTAVKLILKNFAILHSLSYVLKSKEPDTYESYKTKLIDIWDQMKPEDMSVYMSKIEEDTVSILDDVNYKNAFKGKLTKTNEITEKIRQAEKYSKHLVIQQGDSWTNNIMFKLEVEPYPTPLISMSGSAMSVRIRTKSVKEAANLILLEDLKELDYTMLDRFASLPHTAVKLILKNFAILHSLSYVLKSKEPDTYESYKTKLIDIWDQMKPEDMSVYMSKIEEDTVSILDDVNYKNAFKGKLTKTNEITEKIRQAEKYSKHLVIQQGDSWTNNIMFKLEEGTPLDCIMIDYQLSREVNPLCDILYMIFTSTDHKTRSQYYYDWIDYYHEQLDKSLSNFGMKANFVYPRDQLDADLKRYAKMYLGLTVMLHSVLCRTPDEAADIKEAMSEEETDKMQDKAGIDKLSVDTVKEYKSRIEGLIDSYRLFGYM